ncbi:hypothetical protein [Amaricoccus macauensis]|uniref:hypothetical protein n=1 Tax=Amaricoccus macauensis TaxID=57001 RepID=UPI003C79B1EC
MNIRVDNLHPDATALGAPSVTFRNPAGRRSLGRIFVVAVADEVSAVLYDEAGPADGKQARKRLTAELDGYPLEKPFLTTRLDRADGGTRHALLLKAGPEAISKRNLVISLDGQPVAEIDPNWLQSPVSDSSALIDGLNEVGRQRLLRLIMTTGASLFGLSIRSGYGSVTRQLMALLSSRRHELASICPLGSRGFLATFRIPIDEPMTELATLLLECSERTVNLKGFETHVESAGAHRLLHIAIPSPFPAGSSLVALAARPMILEGPADETELQPIVPWLERRCERTRAWVQGLLEARSPVDTVAAAVLRELAAEDAYVPALEVLQLSATRRGLLHALELSDPLDLAQAIRIECGKGHRDIRVRDDDLAGYILWPDRDPGPCRIQIVYRSRRVQTVHEGLPESFDGNAPAALARCEPKAAARALSMARLDGAAPAARGHVQVERFGESPDRVRLSIVAPASANPDLLRARASALFSQRNARQVELVIYGTESINLSELRGKLAECHALFGIAVRLVTLGGTWTRSDALRAAVSKAEGEHTLLLGADVVPEGPEWLSDWLRMFGRAGGTHIVGGTLLNPNGSILDAGAGPDARPRFKGLPAAHLPTASRAATSLVTSECVMLGPDAKACLLSSPSVHPNPDILLADTVVRVLETGGNVRTSFRNLFVRFGPSADSDPLSLAADRIAATEIATGIAREGKV